MLSSIRIISRSVLLLTYFVVSNLCCLFGYMVWMTLLLPVKWIIPRLYWKVEKQLFHWLISVVVSWITLGGYRVVECGDDVNQLNDKECLLLSNHQSTADVPLVMYALHSKGMSSATAMWVIFKLYKFTHFGLVCILREDFFIDAGKAVRHQEMARFKSHLEQSFLASGKKWIVVFPEGGFLCRQKEVCHRFAKKNDLPVLDHVLLPRVGAVKAVLDTLGERYDETTQENEEIVSNGHSTYDNTLETNSSRTSTTVDDTNHSVSPDHNNVADPTHPVEWIIDMTIAYKDKEALELPGIATGTAPHNDILIHWTTHRIRDIPRDEAALTSWLYERYFEKERMLEAYYKDGTVPGPSENSPFPQMKPKYMKFDLLYLFLANTAVGVLIYLQYHVFYKPLGAFISSVWS